MPPPGGRRSPAPDERQRDAVRTRGRILDAAVTEFAAHGYAGARISAIAARAQVNQQLISYYFDGKQGLYRAIADRWREREDELVDADAPLPAQLKQYALEALHNPDGVRLLAWSGLEYAGPDTDPDQSARSARMQRSVDQVRALQQAGRLPTDLDPACVVAMLVAAAMAVTTLPNVLAGICATDTASPEFIEHYAEQVSRLAKLLVG